MLISTVISKLQQQLIILFTIHFHFIHYTLYTSFIFIFQIHLALIFILHFIFIIQFDFFDILTYRVYFIYIPSTWTFYLNHFLYYLHLYLTHM